MYQSQQPVTYPMEQNQAPIMAGSLRGQPQQESMGQHPVCHLLSVLVSSSTLLSDKLHGFHWNVVGPDFGQLHDLFGDAYEEVDEAIDDLAEQLRQLGYPAPYGLDVHLQQSVIPAVTGMLDDKTMLHIAYQDHLKMVDLCKQLEDAAEQANDQATLQIAIDRQMAHSKAAWKARSFLGIQ
jgi:starvation-inducible DNA-binding protein